MKAEIDFQEAIVVSGIKGGVPEESMGMEIRVHGKEIGKDGSEGGKEAGE